MIRRGKETDRAALEALWDYCFEKRTEPFFRFYFDECFRPEETLVYEAGEVAAAVHLRRCELAVRGAVVPVTYIVGLATHPAARGRGYAQELLRAALAESVRLGRYANILMPSAAAYYRPFGWALYAHQWQREAELSSPAFRFRTDDLASVRYEWLDETSEIAALKKLYEAYTANFSGYAVRDESRFRRWLRGQLAEGHVVCAYDGTEPLGYLAYAISGDALTAGEWIAPSERADRALRRFVSRHTGTLTRAVWRVALADESWLDWPDGAEQIYTRQSTFPFMTIRLADAARFWEQIPATGSGRLTVGVVTPADATVTYEVVADGADVSVEPTDAAPELTLATGDLGRLLVGRVNARDLWRAGRLSGAPSAMERLCSLYPRVSTYNNEWY